MKFGFFGGSFDPVHIGHLIAAQDAYEQLHLDRLFLVPAAQAPLRTDSARATPADRLAMLRAATAADPRFETLDWEIRRGEISYTIETVQQARQTFPEADLVWIIGEDQLAKLPQWRQIDQLCRLTSFAFLQRPGHTISSPPAIPGLRLHALHSHQIEISSTEIRQRVRENRAVRFLLPDTVIDYIRQNHLYTE